MNVPARPSNELEVRARNIHPGQWAVEESQPIATLLADNARSLGPSFTFVSAIVKVSR